MKEGLLMLLLSWLGYERRKHQNDISEDRRTLTFQQSKDRLKEALDNFSKIVK